jgi:hypothetical protein
MVFPQNTMEQSDKKEESRKIKTTSNFFQNRDYEESGLRRSQDQKGYRGSQVFKKKGSLLNQKYKKNQSLVFHTNTINPFGTGEGRFNGVLEGIEEQISKVEKEKEMKQGQEVEPERKDTQDFEIEKRKVNEDVDYGKRNYGVDRDNDMEEKDEGYEVNMSKLSYVESSKEIDENKEGNRVEIKDKIEHKKRTTPVKKKSAVQSLYKKSTKSIKHPKKKKKTKKKLITRSNMRNKTFQTIGDPRGVSPVQTSLDNLLKNNINFKKKMYETVHKEEPQENPLKNKFQHKSFKFLKKQKKKPNTKKNQKTTASLRETNNPYVHSIYSKQSGTGSQYFEKPDYLRKKLKEFNLPKTPAISVKKKKKQANKKKPKLSKPKHSVNNSMLKRSKSKPKAKSILQKRKNGQRPYRKHSLILGSNRNHLKRRSTSKIKNSFRTKESFFGDKHVPSNEKKKSTEFTFDEFQKLIQKPIKIKSRNSSKIKRKKPNLQIQIETGSEDQKSNKNVTSINPRTKDESSEQTKSKTLDDIETPKTNSFRKEASSSQNFEESLIIQSQKISHGKEEELKIRRQVVDSLNPEFKDYVFNSQKLHIFRDPKFKEEKDLTQGLCFLKDISDFAKKVIEDNLNLINHFEHFDKSNLFLINLFFFNSFQI